MPVFPEDGSSSVSPGESRPSFSASSTIDSAMRSLTDPPGFWPSSLIRMRTPGLGLSALTSTSGVLPMRSRMLETRAMEYRPPCVRAADGDLSRRPRRAGSTR